MNESQEAGLKKLFEEIKDMKTGVVILVKLPDGKIACKVEKEEETTSPNFFKGLFENEGTFLGFVEIIAKQIHALVGP